MAERFKKASDFVIKDRTLLPKPDLSNIKSRLMVLRAGLNERFGQRLELKLFELTCSNIH